MNFQAKQGLFLLKRKISTFFRNLTFRVLVLKFSTRAPYCIYHTYHIVTHIILLYTSWKVYDNYYQYILLLTPKNFRKIWCNTKTNILQKKWTRTMRDLFLLRIYCIDVSITCIMLFNPYCEPCELSICAFI